MSSPRNAPRSGRSRSRPPARFPGRRPSAKGRGGHEHSRDAQERRVQLPDQLHEGLLITRPQPFHELRILRRGAAASIDCSAARGIRMRRPLGARARSVRSAQSIQMPLAVRDDFITTASQCGSAERLRRGDEEAFMELIRELNPSLLRVARMFRAHLGFGRRRRPGNLAGGLNGIDRFRGAFLGEDMDLPTSSRTPRRTRGERERRSVPFSTLDPEEGGFEPAVERSRFTGTGHGLSYRARGRRTGSSRTRPPR